MNTSLPSAPAPLKQRSSLAFIKTLTLPLLLLAFAGYLLVSMLLMDVPASVDFPGPRFFPALITAGLFLLAGLDIVASLRRCPVAPAEPEKPAGQAAKAHQDSSLRGLSWCIAGFIFFILTLNFLGWILAAGLLFWAVAIGFSAKSYLRTLLAGLTLSSLTYLIFGLGLGLVLPNGFLGGLL